MTSASVGIAASEERADLRTWISVFGCMLGALVSVLDTQITNASLPEIEGGISAGFEDGAWISTSYLIGSIVMIPLTNYLTTVFSFRRLLLGCTVSFLIFSMGCAFATNLGQMIAMRALQGFSAGVMIPMAFTIVLAKLPKSQQPIGFAAFAMTATFGPSIGPTLGGYLTDTYGWRYVFFVNLVPGGLMLALLYPTLDREPMHLGRLREGDWLGVVTMAIGLAALQTVLEEGNQNGWFGSDKIRILSLIAAIFLIAFLVREFSTPRPLVALRLLADRNLGLGTLANVVVGAVLFGAIYLLPTYLDRVQGYNAEQIGFVLAWAGLPQLAILPFVPFLQKHFDDRLIVCVGLAIFAASCFLNIHLDQNFSGDQLMVSNIVRAFGQALVLAPLARIATSTIAAQESGAASGVLNMMRSLGGAVGTAALVTLLTLREEFHSNIIGLSVTSFRPEVQALLTDLEARITALGTLDPERAYRTAVVQLGGIVEREALIMAFSDVFFVLGLALVAALALVLFTRPMVSQVPLHPAVD